MCFSHFTLGSKLSSSRMLAALMSRWIILGWPETIVIMSRSQVQNRIKTFTHSEMKDKGLQSSCRYANPLAEPSAILHLRSQSRVSPPPMPETPQTLSSGLRADVIVDGHRRQC